MKYDKVYFEQLSPPQRYGMLLEFLGQAGDRLQPGKGQGLVHSFARVVADCMNDARKLSWHEEQLLIKADDDLRKYCPVISTMLGVCLPPAGRLHFLQVFKDILFGRN